MTFQLATTSKQVSLRRPDATTVLVDGDPRRLAQVVDT
jgi:hypothetical protein